MKIYLEKKRNILNLKWQSMERKVCLIIKVKSMLIQMVIFCLVDRVFKGKVSEGMSQLRGFYDYAKEEMKVQIMMMIKMVQLWESWLLWFLILSLRMMVMIICEKNIWILVFRRRRCFFNLFIEQMEMMVERMFIVFVIIVEYRDVLFLKFKVLNSIGVQNIIVFMFVNCWNICLIIYEIIFISVIKFC